MAIILRQATLIHPESPFHLQKKDLLIENGFIRKMDDKIDNYNGHYRELKSGNLHVSAGWMDMKSNFCDPGFEQKEDLFSGMKAAAAGGFTGVLLMPSTVPPVQNKSSVEYIRGKCAGNAVSVYPAGALSVNREGRDMTEMFDMKQAGALAFTDDKRPVADSGLMLRALQYGKQVDTLLMVLPEDVGISGKAQVNESLHTTRLGLKGVPSMAEEVMLIRDLYLLEYSGGRIHFNLLSTAGSVDLVRKAKKKGLKVTADTSAAYLVLNDSMLDSFDTNLKIKPPLRSETDQQALLQGLADGTIDVIVSDHSPQDEENKKVEFEFAAFGMISLETTFALANRALENILPLEKRIEKLTLGRTLLGLEKVSIAEGATANLTIFDPDLEWKFSEEDIRSKSKNSPFTGQVLKGKVLGIINNRQVVLQEDLR